MLLLLLFASIIHDVKSASHDEYRIIETNDGHIRGKSGTTLLDNVSYYSFKGIPYAKAPTGYLRFKAPESVKSWRPHVLDAFEHGNICIQPPITVTDLPFSQSEDCLALNIYVPADIKPDEKLSVLLFIHGGGYMEGGGNDYLNGNDFIIEQRVILVTMNYRLGILGFLSLDLPEYSGNMGLKDQQMALKWINENINRFGGDHHRITLIGHSAGSASVHFHILSAESRKYFRNAICMSGSIENYWAFAQEKNNLELAHQIARNLGQPQNSTAHLAEFLQTVEVKKLKSYSTLSWLQGTIAVKFAPVIERKDAKQPFIVDSPKQIYESSVIDTNVLFTFTSLEFLGVIFHPSFSPSLMELNSNFVLDLPFRDLKLDAGSELHRSILDEIRKFYFGNDTIDQQALLPYVSLFSDINFAFGIDRAAKIHANNSRGKTFYSRFSVISQLNSPMNHNAAHLQGASHADEHCYLFRCGRAQSVYNEIIDNKTEEQSKISLQTIRFITKMFTNFAKYDEPSHLGDPVDRFQPIENDVINFLDVTNKGLIPGQAPNQKANDLWMKISQKIHSI